MEWFDSINNIVGMLFGGGLLSLVTWKIARRKAAAEATQAEAVAKQAEAEAEKARAEAAKEKQDYYQQMIKDVAADRDYYKNESDEYRGKLKQYDERINDLERRVARNGRIVEAMRPFLCGDLGCKRRQRVAEIVGPCAGPSTPSTGSGTANEGDPSTGSGTAVEK